MQGSTGLTGTQATSANEEHEVDVREQAADQIRAVADTAKEQTRDVMGDIAGEVNHQVHEQKDRLAAALREVGDELERTSATGNGRVAGLAGEASGHTREIAGWIESHEPGDMVRAVEDFARRRPMLFLAGAAAAGLVVGRITRSAMTSKPSRSVSSTPTVTPVSGGDVPATGALSTGRTSVQASDPHLTGGPSDESLLGESSGPLSQRAYDPESSYPNNDQPVVEVGEELPQAGVRIGQGRTDS